MSIGSSPGAAADADTKSEYGVGCGGEGGTYTNVEGARKGGGSPPGAVAVSGSLSRAAAVVSTAEAAFNSELTRC